MSAGSLNAGSLSGGVYSSTGRSQGQSNSVTFLRLAELRKLRRCQQVAAVCFRVRGGDIEFLLVQTRKGRWIFPKGSAEPGLSHAQAAALEAFEEAGVHGRMEEASFTRYVQRKRGRTRRATEMAVSAHLCEVLRLVPPPKQSLTCRARACAGFYGRVHRRSVLLFPASKNWTCACSARPMNPMVPDKRE